MHAGQPARPAASTNNLVKFTEQTGARWTAAAIARGGALIADPDVDSQTTPKPMTVDPGSDAWDSFAGPSVFDQEHASSQDSAGGKLSRARSAECHAGKELFAAGVTSEQKGRHEADPIDNTGRR